MLKTLMLGKIEGKIRRGWPRIRWLHIFTGSMDRNLSKFWEIVRDRKAWCAAVNGVTKSWTWLNDWTTTTRGHVMEFLATSSQACPSLLLRPKHIAGGSLWCMLFSVFAGHPCFNCLLFVDMLQTHFTSTGGFLNSGSWQNMSHRTLPLLSNLLFFSGYWH